MTFNEALATLPQWVQLWLNILLLGAFIAPLALLIWRETRLAGAIALASSAIGALIITQLYNAMGLVKLLGIGHIFWVPVVIYLVTIMRRRDLPRLAFWITGFVALTMTISLIFDTVDVVRYLAGDRADALAARQGTNG